MPRLPTRVPNMAERSVQRVRRRIPADIFVDALIKAPYNYLKVPSLSLAHPVLIRSRT